MQFSELRNETQQLLVGDLDGCISWESWATCHTSDTGAACECETTDDSDRWESCRAQNCSRNCSPAVHVSCYKSFEPSANSGALPRLYNETLSALVVNGTKATFDPSELQVVEEHPIEFDCNQLVEVVIGVEYNFEMLCPLFKESFNSNFVWENPSMLAHGLLWRQECFDLGVEETRRCFVCLVALEAALGNSSDAWVNLTQNYSTTAIAYNYYDKTRPSWYSDKWSSPHTGDIYIRTPVGLSIHIARQKPASEMWSPEAISVPCLVEQKAFELVVKFTGGMSDLRGDSYPETASLLYSSSGTVRTVGGSAAGSLLARFHTGPVSRVLWSRPGRQRYEMPEEELEAWRSRRNQSGKPSDRHIIRSIASNSSSLRLTLVPPAGGRDTAWSFCFFPADGNHIYKEVCAGKFPVRQSQAECSALSSDDSSMGQRLTIVWLWFLFLLCVK